MKNAKAEIEKADWFDAIVVNDSLEQAFTDLRSCYIAATLSPKLLVEQRSLLLKEWRS